MIELTKEQICDKIAKLKEELVTYEDLLDKMNLRSESEFSAKVNSLVGGYFKQDFPGICHYYRINNVINIYNSHLEGLHAKCECAFISIPKGSYTDYKLSLQFIYIYINERELENFKPITKEEFEEAVNNFNEKFNSPT